MSDRLLKESDVLREVKSLLISDETRHLNDLEYGNNQALYHVIDRIEDLPSAESRKKGKWIKNPEFCGDDVSGSIDNHFSCSECKKEAEINSWGFYILSDFCPHCGADMREGEKSEIN